MNTVKAVMLAAGTVVLLSPWVMAEMGGRGNGGGPKESMEMRHEGMMENKRAEKHFSKMEKELGLSREQKEKMQAHRKKQQEKMREVNTALRQKRAALREELNKADTDLDKAKAIATEIKALTSQQIDNRIEAIQEMKTILTPEQFKKMGELREQKMRESKERMKNRKKGKKDGPMMKHGMMEEQEMPPEDQP